MPNPTDDHAPRRVRRDPDGPLLVEGPVEFVDDDGTVHTSRRFTVAVCTCRRSGTYPWCDTSHRRRTPRRKPDRTPDRTPDRKEAP